MESFLNDAFSGTHIAFSVFLLIGTIDLIIIFFMWRFRRIIISKGQQTTARIVDLSSGSGSRGGVYYPVFQFSTFLNEQITQRSKVGSNPPAYKQDEEVVIFYNPEKPQQFVVQKDKRFRLIFLIIGGLATIFFLVGLFGLLPVIKEHF